jgi:hypothetical protein
MHRPNTPTTHRISVLPLLLVSGGLLIFSKQHPFPKTHFLNFVHMSNSISSTHAVDATGNNTAQSLAPDSHSPLSRQLHCPGEPLLMLIFFCYSDFDDDDDGDDGAVYYCCKSCGFNSSTEHLSDSVRGFAISGIR